MVGVAGITAPAYSTVPSESGFESDDGNLVVDSTFDWNGFAPTTWSGDAPYRTSSKTASGWSFTGLEDAESTTADTAFAGGTKQDDDCASLKDAKAPNKDDLKRVYVSYATVGGDVFLNLAWVRIPQNTTSPSAHIGFEFNQGSTPCPGTDLVEREVGDMLIVYDFEGGSTDTPTITLRRWVDSGSCEVGSNSPPCWGPSDDLTADGFAVAKVNTGSSVTDTIAPAPPEDLGLNEFGEAGINLTDAGVFSSNACTAFGQTFAVSRSSGNSANAQMKDLVGPGDINITNCGSVIIRKVTDPSGDTTTEFDYSTTGGLTPATFKLKDGQKQDYGSTVFAGPYTVTEADPSAENYDLTDIDCSASSQANGTTINTDLGSRTVDFDLKPLDTVDCTFTNTLRQGALKILKQSTKTGNPLVANAGAVFTYDSTSVTDNGAGDEDNTIGEVCVSGLVPGDYTVNETSPPDGYGAAGSSQADQTVTVVNGTNCGNNEPTGSAVATFTNPPLADIQVNYKDGGSGETSLTSIECQGLGTNPDTLDDPAASGWDQSSTHEDIPIDPSPRTITCTIVIDP